MENIIENNKLIAEFMGLKPKMESPDVYVFNDMPYFSVRENNPEDVMNAIVKYSKYDSDWNWLMPVVEKIESLGNDILITSNYIQITYDKGEKFITIELEGNIKIFAVYNACIEFIKWYNEQNKEQLNINVYNKLINYEV